MTTPVAENGNCHDKNGSKYTTALPILANPLLQFSTLSFYVVYLHVDSIIIFICARLVHYKAAKVYIQYANSMCCASMYFYTPM